MEHPFLVFFALPCNLVLLLQGICFQLLEGRILPILSLTQTMSRALNTDCEEQADFCGVVNPFLHSHPVFLSLPFLQVDKVCGQPKQQEGNLSSASIVPVKEVTETQTFMMAHTSLNNKRR